MCFDFVCVSVLLKTGLLKKLCTTHVSLILCWCIITNHLGISLGTYYQITNILNTKNNHVVVMFFIYVNFLLNKKFFINNTPLGLITTLTLIYTTIICCMYVDLTSTDSLIILENLNLNLNLLNGLMLIHPPILYILYSIILYTIYLSIYKIHTQYMLPTTQTHTHTTIILLIFSNILGCWWAEQELTWGGWWGWDFVEILLLNILIYTLSKLHSKYKGLNNLMFYKQIFFSYKCSILVIIIVVSVRYNFINSIHNFVNSQIQNQHYYTLCSVLLVFLLYANKGLLGWQHLDNSRFGIFFKVIVFLFLFLYITTITLPFVSEYNINTNKIIKLIYYFVTLYITISLYFLLWSTTTSTKLPINHTYCNPIYIFIKFVFCFLDYVYVFLLVFVTLKKNKNKKNIIKFLKLNNFHKFIIFFLLVFLHQTYIFANDMILISIHNSIILLKVSNQVIYQIFYQNLFINDFHTIKNLSEVITSTYNKGNLFLLLDMVFDKKLYTYLYYLKENYNFDLQILYESVNFILCWGIIPALIIIVRVFFFFKKGFF